MRSFLLILLSCISSLFAAAPITHIYFAEKWLESSGEIDISKAEAFILGTLFPDVRYLGGLSREITHEKDVELSQVINCKDPFKAGMLFHAYIDELREKVAHKWNIYEEIAHIAKGREARFLLKFVEDEILYNQINQNFCIDALGKILDKEVQVVSYYKAYLWHALLADYLKKGPQEMVQGFAEGFCWCFYPQFIFTWDQHFQELIENERIQMYVSDLIRYLQDEMHLEMTEFDIHTLLAL